MTITIPQFFPGANPTGQTSYVQTQLYNWKSQTWDTISINNAAFTSSATSAYIGLDGRVLLQVTHPANSGNTLYLGKPSLSLT
jgi:hypothetical protein